MDGAGSAGWLWESGSRLPQSEAFGCLVRRGENGEGGKTGWLGVRRGEACFRLKGGGMADFVNCRGRHCPE